MNSDKDENADINDSENDKSLPLNDHGSIFSDSAEDPSQEDFFVEGNPDPDYGIIDEMDETDIAGSIPSGSSQVSHIKPEKKKLGKYVTVIFLNIIVLAFALIWFDKSYPGLFKAVTATDSSVSLSEKSDDPDKISIILQDGASIVDRYHKLPDAPEYPRHMPVLTLSGTWYEMGKQYGQGAAGYIRTVFDGFYEKWAVKPFGNSYLKECLKKYDSQIQAFSPDMIDFMKGIADGAGRSLSLSKYKRNLTDYEKILFINLSSELLYNDKWHEKNSGKKISPSMINPDIMPGGNLGTCWAALPACTSGRVLITGVNSDSDYFPNLYHVALRAYPSDKKLIPFIMVAPAGFAGSVNNINNSGLFLGYCGVGGGYNPEKGVEELDYGVPAPILSTFVISHCNRVVAAKHILANGTEGYRKKTGSKTLLHCSGANYLIARKERAIVVERSAHHFSFRYPGNSKEFNNAYIAAANHFVGVSSYNREGIESYAPMSDFGWGTDSEEARFSVAKFNTVLHQLKVYYRRMNINLGMLDICSLNSFVDGDDIERVSVNVKGEEIPAREMGWSVDIQLKRNNIPLAGTVSAFVNLPQSGKTFLVQGSPSDWFGDWDTVYLERESGPDVLPFSE